MYIRTKLQAHNLVVSTGSVYNHFITQEVEKYDEKQNTKYKWSKIFDAKCCVETFYEMSGAVPLGGQGGHLTTQCFRNEKSRKYEFRSFHILCNSFRKI